MDNKDAIFNRIFRDVIIIRIGDDWRKELGRVKPEATTAEVIGELTRLWDFKQNLDERTANHALLVGCALAAQTTSTPA